MLCHTSGEQLSERLLASPAAVFPTLVFSTSAEVCLLASGPDDWFRGLAWVQGGFRAG